jgi:hypothetical protein
MEFVGNDIGMLVTGNPFVPTTVTSSGFAVEI